MRLRLLPLPTAALAALCAIVLGAPPAPAASPDPADDPRRVALATLRPSTTAAVHDSPAPYRDGCHAGATATVARGCTYGNRSGRVVVVALGDSHIAHWFPALDAVARAEGWRLVWFSKSACPVADVALWRSYPQCSAWRRSAIARIRALPRVDLVVASSSHRPSLRHAGTSGPVTAPSARAVLWRAGLNRTLTRLTGQVRRYVVLRDTPTFVRDVPSCLRAARGDALACSRPRSTALPSALWDQERVLVARRSWTRAVDMSDRICQPSRCLPVTSTRVLRWRDTHHLTATFARALSGSLRYRLLVALR